MACDGEVQSPSAVFHQGDLMHKVTFFPNGNADTYLIELENGRRVLVDYAHRRNPDGRNPDGAKDLRIDLPSALKETLGGSDHIDVVALTHGHDDHIDRASEFFFLRHSRVPPH